jgi:hypothetical protein
MLKNLVQRAVAAALVATAAFATPSSASTFTPCVPATVYFCLRETGGGPGQTLYRVQSGPQVSLGTVAAYLGIYKFDTFQIPCVTPVVNGTRQDACAALGFELVREDPLMDETSIGANVPQPVVLGSVYVCDALLTATVASVGVVDRPVVSLCHDGLSVSGQ